MKKIITVVVLLTTSMFSLQAQEGDQPVGLITDRPDATEAPTTVPKSSLQVETGTFFTNYEDGVLEENVIGYNTTLLRYGLSSRLELRVGWNFEETTINLNNQEIAKLNGFSPLLFGAKVAIFKEQGWMPEVGLIGHLFLPFTASSDYKPEYTSADFRFAFNHTLSEKSGLAYNIGGQYGGDSPELAYIYTIAYGYALTDQLGMYVELYGDLPEDSRANHFWDAGLTYAVAPLVQLDATIGRSITEGQDLLLSAGVSFRIDKNKQ
ncbi:transporter [Dokdonia sp. Hel_I_53]|uniref:transporter n=1 Tax=Dokdonia sp. Hel_I_53 TaxID=1566287 RepID=UPI00119C315E|nr:transporter [Dokdonia sp. Hel_I_53]TVZ52862.1 outer membrane putative beta-barrel porin/alpha-amylase [Dokdonia sp. Hel_I_53]